MTILRGLMTPSLGGFSTIRGYAPLKVLESSGDIIHNYLTVYVLIANLKP